MKHWKTVVATVTAWTFLYGCSTQPDKVSSTYVSPLMYQSYNCNQIQGEVMRVNRKVIEVTGAQKSEADKDAVAMGVGLILFWPALFFLIGDDKSGELAHLKGEYDALEQVAIIKECDVATQLAEARRQREAQQASFKTQQEQATKGVH